MLRYAYAELEESRGAIQVMHLFTFPKYSVFSYPLLNVLMQAAKKVYESLFGDGSNASALSHIQVRP